MDLNDKKILLLGSTGMVGRAIDRALFREGIHKVLRPTSRELDLTIQSAVNDYFAEHRPDIVIIAAAKVGGILANDTYRADFLAQNLAIAANTICAAHDLKVEKLIFLGSSCIYPKEAAQPMPEEALLTGPLEPTNEPYAVAKIAGIKLCENFHRQYGDNFFSLMPPNLYGPYDNFDAATSHVIPALLTKFHKASRDGDDAVTVWGSGKPLREFMHVDDLADAVIFAIRNLDADVLSKMGISHLNVGSGQEISIRQLSELIAEIAKFEGRIDFDVSKPDGVQRKLMDSSRIRNLGWRPSIDLGTGLRAVSDWYTSQQWAANNA
jgi:nucleoside-diphosphate-sugar epimerase